MDPLNRLTRLKEKLDTYRPFSQDIVDNLSQWFDIELTYSSNAIEGNTLTRQETSLVIEKGLTIGGKPLKDHLEAINHQKALRVMYEIARQKNTLLSLENILSLHDLILKGIDDQNAGVIRIVPVRISGSEVILPNALKVKDLLMKFLSTVNGSKEHPVKIAAMAHYQLVSIHPFIDCNGRTARLLMNALLIGAGYPPAIILPKNRLAYIKSLEKAQLGGSIEDYLNLIYGAVKRSINVYLKAVSNESPVKRQLEPNLLKIGQLSTLSKETISTIRYWTKMGLLDVADTTTSGYQLYSPKMQERINTIRKLQKDRYTIEEIFKKIDR